MSYDDWVRRQEAARRQERHTKIEREEYLRNLPEKERMAIRWAERVLPLWERLQQHRLSADRRNEFIRRPEVQELSQLQEKHLEVAAQRAMKADRGRLLLDHWLDEARNVATEEAEQESFRATARAESLLRAEKIATAQASADRTARQPVQICASCGVRIDELGQCACS